MPITRDIHVVAALGLSYHLEKVCKYRLKYKVLKKCIDLTYFVIKKDIGASTLELSKFAHAQMVRDARPAALTPDP